MIITKINASQISKAVSELESAGIIKPEHYTSVDDSGSEQGSVRGIGDVLYELSDDQIHGLACKTTCALVRSFMDPESLCKSSEDGESSLIHNLRCTAYFSVMNGICTVFQEVMDAAVTLKHKMEDEPGEDHSVDISFNEGNTNCFSINDCFIISTLHGLFPDLEVDSFRYTSELDTVNQDDASELDNVSHLDHGVEYTQDVFDVVDTSDSTLI